MRMRERNAMTGESVITVLPVSPHTIVRHKVRTALLIQSAHAETFLIAHSEIPAFPRMTRAHALRAASMDAPANANARTAEMARGKMVSSRKICRSNAIQGRGARR